MFDIITKQFSIITLLIFIFFVPHIFSTSFAQTAEKTNPLNLETLLGETTSTSGVMSGSMKFQYEMAELLGERVGPDDSGNVHHAGGLSSFYTGPKKLFPGKGTYGHLYNFLPVIRL
jgi:hydroxylamine dehydrogenase